MLGTLVSDAIADFLSVAAMAGAPILASQIHVDILAKPHRPKSLPMGKMAVYSFFLDGQALKVGKVGPNSGPRFTHQHYAGSAMSTLAETIFFNHHRVGAASFTHAKFVGDWIKANTDRVDILVPATVGLPTLSLLEAFLHVRWNPMFEGRAEN